MHLNSADAKMTMPHCTPTQKLIAAALALTGCRILSAWDSVLAAVVAIAILLVLTVDFLSHMPRLRRILTFAVLPTATLVNAGMFALGSFGVLLGAQGLLVYDRIGGGLPWSWAFVIVPLAAGINIVAFALPEMRSRRIGVWSANLALAAYAAWHWTTEASYARMLGRALPAVATLLLAVSIMSLAAVILNVPVSLPQAGARKPRAWWRGLVLGAAVAVTGLLWVALIPVYHNRQIAQALASHGLSANFGTLPPGWRLPFELPFEWYDYLGEVTGVFAPESFKGDPDAAGRLLSTLPGLWFFNVNDLPEGGERILEPLAVNKRLAQIGLNGPGVIDKTLADAARLPALNLAFVEAARITDDGLAHLAKAVWLQWLAIRRTPISGNGLRHLQSLPRLATLDVSGTNLGDEQAALLVQFPMLTDIWLYDTRITDAGLTSLAKCKALQTIDLTGSQVTKSGVERLRRALPGCSIICDP